MATSRWTQAIEGLSITREGGLVLVKDGQTRWICEEPAWDELRELMLAEEPLDESEDPGLAYSDLCQRVDGTILCSMGGGNGQGTEVEKRDLARQAKASGLIQGEPCWEHYVG